MPRAAKTKKAGWKKSIPLNQRLWMELKNKLHRLKRGNEAGYQPGFNPHFYNLCKTYPPRDWANRWNRSGHRGVWIAGGPAVIFAVGFIGVQSGLLREGAVASNFHNKACDSIVASFQV